jgi:hypothetical protein
MNDDPNRKPREAAMKMRQHVDAVQGEGSWDRMHDAIDRGDSSGWSLPPIEVDGMRASIYPGEDREVTVETVNDEIRKVFRQVHGDDFADRLRRKEILPA